MGQIAIVDGRLLADLGEVEPKRLLTPRPQLLDDPHDEHSCVDRGEDFDEDEAELEGSSGHIRALLHPG